MADTTSTVAEKSPEQIAQENDLLPKLTTYLNRHLLYPLLNFKSSKNEESGVADDLKLKKAKYELLKPTNMIDFVTQLYMELNNLDETPAEFSTKKIKVLEKLDVYKQSNERIQELLTRDEVVSGLRSDKVANFEYLKKDHQVTMEMIDNLFEFGTFQYNCGNYPAAADLLYQFRILSTNNDKCDSATWGKLASEILMGNWDIAVEEINKVKDTIDTRGTTSLFNNPLEQLHQRTWLIHWALFPFFNHEPARDTITELFFSPAFINTIQNNCPWILRYLAAAVITNRNRSKNTGQYQKQLKDIIRIVKQETYEYNDPVTDFIKALEIDFDFEEAQKKLKAAEEVVSADFFLVAISDTFVEAARHLISDSYCKIHQGIDIQDLSTRLGLGQLDEGESTEKIIMSSSSSCTASSASTASESTVVPVEQKSRGTAEYDALVKQAANEFAYRERKFYTEGKLSNEDHNRLARDRSDRPCPPAVYFARHHVEIMLTLKGVKPCTLISGSLESQEIRSRKTKECLLPIFEEFKLEQYGFILQQINHPVPFESNCGAQGDWIFDCGFQGDWIFADTRSSKWKDVEGTFLTPHPGQTVLEKVIGNALGYPLELKTHGSRNRIVYTDSTEKDRLIADAGGPEPDAEYEFDVYGMAYCCPTAEASLQHLDALAISLHFNRCRKAASDVGWVLCLDTGKGLPTFGECLDIHRVMLAKMLAAKMPEEEFAHLRERCHRRISEIPELAEPVAWKERA